MSCIDPDSPRTIGRDTNGNTVRLGDHDSDGYFVGYISETGDAYESRAELERANCSGRYDDAARPFHRSGGILGELPDPQAFVDAAVATGAVSPENADEIVEHISEWEFEIRPLLAVTMAPQLQERARLN